MAGRGTSSSGKGDFRRRFVVNPSPVALSKILGGLGPEFRDWRPAWRRLVPVIASGIAENISSRGASIGVPWAPVDARYARRKASEGKGRLDLFVTGWLIDDVTSPDSVVALTPRRLSFGTQTNPYARAVNFAGRKRFMGWNQRMEIGAALIMDDHARALIAKASARIAALARTVA